MPQRLEIARLQLRELKADRLFNNHLIDTELVAITKLNEVLALLKELQVMYAQIEQEKHISLLSKDT